MDITASSKNHHNTTNNTTNNTAANTTSITAKKPKRISPYRSGSSSDVTTNDNNNITSSSLENLSTTLTRAKKLSVNSTATSTTTNSANTTSASNVSTTGKKEYSHCYYVGKSNGWKLVKDSMDKRGWTQLPFDYQFSTRYGLKWVERRIQIDYRAHQPGQLVCHIPNNDCICTKVGLLTTLRDKFCRPSTIAEVANSTSCSQSAGAPISSSMSTTIIVRKHPPCLPESYDLDSPSDIQLLFQEIDISPETIWIYKPPCSNRGRGIQVISGKESVHLLCYGKVTADPETSIAPAKGIIQRYITYPLLVSTVLTPQEIQYPIEEAGYKFDIRCYLLIARTYPNLIAFYHPGYCRLALKAYPRNNEDLLKSSLEDTMMHLTNASIQKKSSHYTTVGDSQIQSIGSIIENMRQTGRESTAMYMESQLDNDIKAYMTMVLQASSSKFLKTHGYFDLLGCDFMITEENKLILLEINTNPAMSLDNRVLENLLPNVIDSTLELVLQVQGPDVELFEQVQLSDPLPGQFQLIYDEGRQWMFPTTSSSSSS
jgi:tubulin--tyrosine ligase like protein 10